ncbi:hypothetical protein ACFL6R_00740 [Gemmatimonadota bacterium]
MRGLRHSTIALAVFAISWTANGQSVDPASILVREIGSADTTASEYVFGLIADIAIGPDGNVYVVDTS